MSFVKDKYGIILNYTFLHAKVYCDIWCKIYTVKIKFSENLVLYCEQFKGNREQYAAQEVNMMNSKDTLPMMLSANEIQAMGFTRTMAYNILNRDDVPVVKIGNRKFIQRDKFFEWLDNRERGDDE